MRVVTLRVGTRGCPVSSILPPRSRATEVQTVDRALQALDLFTPLSPDLAVAKGNWTRR